MINFILCGGSGTRLWPLSRTLMPKQFVKLFNAKSLFQLTVERNSTLCDEQFIVSNSEQYFLAYDQLEELGRSNNRYLLEPIGRNTAPAIALACLSVDPEAVVLVTPSDHLIKNQDAYKTVVKRAEVLAKEGFLVTFGITPSYPEMGYGYIEADGEDVKSFKEKPDSSTAQSYIDKGNYYWNSGMFCFKAGVFLNELKHYSPQIYEASVSAYNHAKKDTKDAMVRIGYDEMLSIPEDSVDYAVMEKSTKVKVVPSNIDWSDVVSFDALSNELPNDEKNNFILSHKQVCTMDVEDLVRAHIDAIAYLDIHESYIFNVDYEKGYSFKELIQTIRDVPKYNIQAIVSPRQIGDSTMLIANTDKMISEMQWNPKYNRHLAKLK